MAEMSDTQCAYCFLWTHRLSYASYTYCDDFCEERYYRKHNRNLPEPLAFRISRRNAKTALWSLERKVGSLKEIADRMYRDLDCFHDADGLWKWVHGWVVSIVGHSYSRTKEEGGGFNWSEILSEYAADDNFARLQCLHTVYCCFWK